MKLKKRQMEQNKFYFGTFVIYFLLNSDDLGGCGKSSHAFIQIMLNLYCNNA